MNHGLALDFFHLAPGEQPLRQDLPAIVEEAIRHRRHIANADEATLPRIEGVFQLTQTRQGLYCLNFETAHHASGLIYALTYKVFRYLDGHIYALTAHTVRERTYLSIYHGLPVGRDLEEARAIVAKRFADTGA
jgi:hypothetical protein